MTRRRRRGPSRCNRCQRIVRWLSHRGARWMFDPRPIDPRTHCGPPAYPVEGGIAWRHSELVEDLMGRRECSRQDAIDETYDMPWHVLHACHGRTPHHATDDHHDKESLR